MIPQTILYAAGESFHASPLSEALRLCGSEMVAVGTEDRLLHLLGRFSPDCAVVVCAPQVDTETVRIVQRIRRLDQHCPLLVLTSAISAESITTALSVGASDLLEQDAPVKKILARLESFSAPIEQCRIKETVCPELLGGDRMVGHGAAISKIRSYIARIAATSANVLITGESGTGKELAAELIHRNSSRSSRLFVAVNCAAVPDTLLESELFGHARGAFTGAGEGRAGKLENANGGTLFLDEVGDMSLAAQAKILRATDSSVIQRLGSNQDTRVNVRLVAATNQDLESLMREKKFRRDLYYRLNVVRLNLPPLRDRTEDIPELVEHMLREVSNRQSTPVRRIENGVIRRLQSHDWPGNIRELRNVLESILVFSSSRSIGLSDVPVEIRQTLHTSSNNSCSDRSKILSALDSADWNRDRAAKILCCSRMTLYRKMVKYSIPDRRKSDLEFSGKLKKTDELTIEDFV